MQHAMWSLQVTEEERYLAKLEAGLYTLQVST